MSETLNEFPVLTDLPANLRAGQTLAIDKAIDHFADNDRGILWMCCGSGKTVACAVITELRHEDLTVVFSPYIHLVKQWRDDYLKWLPTTQAKILCVCSEKDTDREGDFRGEAKLLSAAGSLPAEEFVELVEEARNSKGQTTVSTDPNEIAAFLKQPGRKVVFCTYASAPVYGEGQKKAGVAADFGVFDEAQMTATGGQSNRYTHALHDENIKINQRLFTTATVRHYTREGLEFSMDNEEIYGGHILVDDNGKPDPWSINKAAAHHEIAPYRIVLSFVTDPKFSPDLAKVSPYREILEDVGHRAKPEQILRLVSQVVALERAKNKYGIEKPLGFLRNVTSANLYADILNACKKYPEHFPHLSQSDKAVSISSYDLPAKRKASMAHLHNATETEVSNARLFIFGADEPSIDAVSFNDPMSSGENVVQASGRALRYRGGKVATIIVPVMLPSFANRADADVQQIMPETIKGAFRPVIDILDRLADMDPILKNQMTRGTSGPGKGPAQKVIELDIPPELFTGFQDQIEVATWREINPETDFIDKLLFDAKALEAYRLQQFPSKDVPSEEAIAAEQRAKIRIIPELTSGYESTGRRMGKLRRDIAAWLEDDGREGRYGTYVLTTDRVLQVYEHFGWDDNFVQQNAFVEALKEDAAVLNAYRLQQYPAKSDPSEEAAAAEQRASIRIVPHGVLGLETTSERMGDLRRGIAAWLEADSKDGKYGHYLLTTERVRQVYNHFGWDHDYIRQDAFVEALKEDARMLDIYRLQQYPKKDDPIEEAAAAKQRAGIKIIPRKTPGFKSTAQRMGRLRRSIGDYLKGNNKEREHGSHILNAERIQQVYDHYGWDDNYVQQDVFVEAIRRDAYALDAFRLQQHPTKEDPNEEAAAAEQRANIKIIPQRAPGYESSGRRMGNLRRSVAAYLESNNKEATYGSHILNADRVQEVYNHFGWDDDYIRQDAFVEALKEDARMLDIYRLQQYPKKDDPIEEAAAAKQRAGIRIISRRASGFGATTQRMMHLRRGIATYLENNGKEGKYENYALTAGRVQQVLKYYGWDEDFVLNRLMRNRPRNGRVKRPEDPKPR
ncbi:MAG: DEAD/DEAH box helicase family protein [Bdellovibrionales bacterium]